MSKRYRDERDGCIPDPFPIIEQFNQKYGYIGLHSYRPWRDDTNPRRGGGAKSHKVRHANRKKRRLHDDSLDI